MAADKNDAARYLANWQDEIDGAALYRALAEVEKQPQLSQVYNSLAEAEEKHARLWEEKLREAGETIPPRRPGWRTRTLIRLARRFGPQLVLPTIAGMEQADSRRYDAQAEARANALPTSERSHARIIGAISGTVRGGMEGAALAQIEGRHRATGGNALRAAVLGANDGLVSNLSLVMGVAGAALSGQAILITGLAGLLAGAGSMAMGEWLSVQSSRELYGRQIAIERAEIAAAPEEEAAELALIYEAKGVPQAEAQRLSQRLIANQETALDTLAREELGIDPEELGGSAWQAAATSFVLFAIGAIVPVAPFIVLSGAAAVVASLLVSALALFLIGAGITLLTGRGVLFSGARQVLFGLAAAIFTYGIGRLIGVAIGG